MAVRPQSALSAEPNVTPMIDVLLVVIIVFMVAMVRMRQTMDVQLPVPSTCAGNCAAGDQVVLEVLPGPRYRVNRRPVPDGALLAELLQIYSARPEKIVHVAGDPRVSYDDVIAAMDIAKSAGVRVIGVAPKGLAAER